MLHSWRIRDQRAFVFVCLQPSTQTWAMNYLMLPKDPTHNRLFCTNFKTNNKCFLYPVIPVRHTTVPIPSSSCRIFSVLNFIINHTFTRRFHSSFSVHSLIGKQSKGTWPPAPTRFAMMTAEWIRSHPSANHSRKNTARITYIVFKDLEGTVWHSTVSSVI